MQKVILGWSGEPRPPRIEERDPVDETMRCLTELAMNEEALVHAVGGPHLRARRIMSLGLSPGARVRMVRRAPLGDPLEFDVSGCLLMLRSEEAAGIVVEG
ncbi:MAG: FeoA family protein [Candidatus Xenobium sp.]